MQQDFNLPPMADLCAERFSSESQQVEPGARVTSGGEWCGKLLAGDVGQGVNEERA